jgi:hypothetical protein
MRSAIRIAVAVLAVLAAFVYFFASAEDEGGVPIWDWLRDPSGSRERHAAHLAGESAAAEEALAREQHAGGGGPAGPLPRASGRVLRLDGSPVPGLGVHAGTPQLGRVTSDARGRFALPPGAELERAQLDDDAWILLGSGKLAAGAKGEELVLVVAERTALAGRVMDPTGEPIEGALVSAYTPLAVAAAEEVPIELPAHLERRALTDAEGRFLLPDLPRLASVRIDASKPGFERVRRPLPEDTSGEVEIALAPQSAEPPPR